MPFLDHSKDLVPLDPSSSTPAGLPLGPFVDPETVLVAVDPGESDAPVSSTGLDDPRELVVVFTDRDEAQALTLPGDPRLALCADFLEGVVDVLRSSHYHLSS